MGVPAYCVPAYCLRRHLPSTTNRVATNLGANYSKLINDALQRLSYDAEVYRPELARTTFLKAQLLEKMGKVQKANVAYKVSGRLRAEVIPDDKRDVKSLAMKDFDDIVTFWTR